MKETATLAGGCFWCTEAIFKRLKGVISVLPGYSGGLNEAPSYEEVCTGETQHAESVQIEFENEEIPFEKILEIFFATHDPTTLNQQGANKGTQYRSATFYHDEKQKQTAIKLKSELEKEETYKNPILTEITKFTNFYPAEDYHQNYFDKNKNAAYCNLIINPKIHKLLEKFGKNIKEEYQ